MKCPACNKKLKYTKKRIPFLSVEFFKSLIYIEDSATCSQCTVKLVGNKSRLIARNLGFLILLSGQIIYLTTTYLYGHKFINIVGAIAISCSVLAMLLFLYSIVKLKDIKVSNEG